MAELKIEGWIREFTTEKLKEMWQDANKLKANGDEDEEMKQPIDSKSGATANTGSTKVNIILLYPIDKDDKEVEPRSHQPAKSLKLLRGIWNDE